MRFFRFRIISLLVLMALAAGVLAWLVQPKMVTAKAIFLIPSGRTYIESLLAPDAPPLTERQITTKRETARVMVISPMVIRAALGKLSNAKTFLKNVDDPEQWLIDHLTAEFDSDSDILDVRLEGGKNSKRISS